MNKPPYLAPENYWIVSEHADVLAVFDSEVSSNDMTEHIDVENAPIGWKETQRYIGEKKLLESGLDVRTFIQLDDPRHAKYRKPFMRLVNRRSVEAIEEFVRSETKKRVKENLNSDSFDLTQDLVHPILLDVMLEIVGIEELKDNKESIDWATIILMRQLGPAFGTDKRERETQEFRDDINKAFAMIVEIMQPAIDRRKENPNGDFLSQLIHDDKMSEMSIHLSIITFLSTFRDAVESSINKTFMLLTERKDIQEEIRKGMKVDRKAFMEFVRFTDGAIGWSLVLKKDVEINGVFMKKGMYVYVDITSANHDPKVFENPYEINFNREKNPILSFGSGIHACMGIQLAQMEMSAIVEETILATSSIELTGETESYNTMILNKYYKIPFKLIG
jgi:hypothetical protein